MKRLFQIDSWKIVETELHKEDFRLAESMMSIGNGHMGMRGNFEETYSLDSHLGTYIGGVYYPDKTRVGWWKNGYPEYFAKVLNAPNFMGIKVHINGVELDLSKVNVVNYYRELDMKNGVLTRVFTIVDEDSNQTNVEVKRFLSVVKKEVAVVAYAVTPINHNSKITFTPFIDGDVRNEDSNYDEDFWDFLTQEVSEEVSTLSMRTRKTEFDVSVSMINRVSGGEVAGVSVSEGNEFIAQEIVVCANQGEKVTLHKYVGVTTSRDYAREKVAEASKNACNEAEATGFEALLLEHSLAWNRRWEQADVVIEGDDEAQQGIRFNLFQLFSTYYGEDSRLNIGPKGFTGEKYGGSTYWDTEAYCLPMYLATADQEVARNLLFYRYNQLPQAKINAGRQGLKGALYPMVTMDGLESHNEWEITFEEIHRNGAIAYAIYNYTNYTGDKEYLQRYGCEVLTEISRFWADRVHYHGKKQVYMMHGVTGPNEYENNINNNWYTNLIAQWTISYTMEILEELKVVDSDRYAELQVSQDELSKWQAIVEKMYLPYDAELDVFVQHDGFLDKELMTVDDLKPEDRPLNQNWSWDKILRSCFIKQADVLQGVYLFGDCYSKEVKKRNFDFYEPMTVHESSLSPCIYSVIAAEIGYEEKAYEFYLRTSRLDLDNYNNDTEDGLHITSMSGSWLTIVQGFAGMRTWDNKLSFAPFIPQTWNGYSFKINYRNHLLQVSVVKDAVTIAQLEGKELTLNIYGADYVIEPNGTITIEMQCLAVQ